MDTRYTGHLPKQGVRSRVTAGAPSFCDAAVSGTGDVAGFEP